jgi:putative membrane protein
MLVHLIVNWLVAALALYIVAMAIKGFEISGFGAAMIGAAVIALVDAILGPVLRFFSFPITVVTLGLFRLVINAILLKVAAAFTPGFRIVGFLPALIGALALTLVRWILGMLLNV